MSTITYMNSDNQVPVQPPTAPPQPLPPNFRVGRGGGLGANFNSNMGANYNSNFNPNLGPNYNPNLGPNYNYNPNIEGNYNANQGGNYYPNPDGNYNPNIGGNFRRNFRRTYNRNIWNSNYRNVRRNRYGNNMFFPNYQQRSYQPQMVPRRNLYQQMRYNSNRRRSMSNRPRSNSRSRRGQPTRQRPRQLRLNDYMPEQLRQRSTSIPNLPSEFELADNRPLPSPTTMAATTAPTDALPQRERFATAAANNTASTQPFIINPNEQIQQQPLQQQRATTATISYRRRQRRIRQQQYQDMADIRNNRFAVLSDNENNTDVDEEENTRPPNKKKKEKENKKSKISKKIRAYLEPNRILRWFEDYSRSSKSAISGRGNQAYVLASAPIYDEWVRNNYELQIWQSYLKLGTEHKQWAKEVVQRTKKRDDTTNTRFIQKKINKITTDIAQASVTVSDLQIQLTTYWNYTNSEQTTQRTVQATAELAANMVIERMRDNSAQRDTINRAQTQTPTLAAGPQTTTTSIKNTARELVDRVEKHILEYIHQCTQHIRKRAEIRVQIARTQMAEFKALEDFEQIATPSQWTLHMLLKPKMKIWSIKKKNLDTLTKRIEYDIPPKFIGNIECNFKIDESIISADEAQVIYNQMARITKDFRTQTTTLYLQSLGRENELISDEIKRMIHAFPQENDDGFDAEAGFAAFQQYHELRGKRLNLEIEHSLYFLEEQRVEGEANPKEETAIAPTVVRTLGEEFSLHL